MELHSAARRRSLRLASFVALLGLCVNALAFELVPSLPSPQPLGTTITWTVTGDPPQPGDVVDFRLMVRQLVAGETAHVVYDFALQRSFEWTPMEESVYLVTVIARNETSGEISQLNEVFVALARARSEPVVSTTRNPLVALYSAPPCEVGLTMEVTFRAEGDTNVQSTNRKVCNGTRSMNFLVAGMRAETTYRLRYRLRNLQGDPAGSSAPLEFVTGTPDPGVPTVTVVTPPKPGTSFRDDYLLAAANSDVEGTTIAADLRGNLVWYYTSPDQDDTQFLRIKPGGNMLLTAAARAPEDRLVLREVDLASNIVRETNSRRITEQLHALGQPTISVVHHEARPLPNGHTLVLGSTERFYEDVQGPGRVDVLGDVVIDLDEELQVVWATNLYDVLDVSRVALLGEVCTTGSPGCPPIFLAEQANDWTHSNAIGYSPSDGNLIISSRHQDWVSKIDYRDGAGTGGLVWRLGRDGDFTLLSSEANDGWFSHQHDANYLDANLILLYDNGNGNPDCLADPNLCRSFGKLYRIDENTMTARLLLDADLQNFSFAIGAAQRLSNGNFLFTSGIYDGSQVARSQEVDPQGNILFEQEVSRRSYRSFRLPDLYTPPQY